MNKLRFVKDSTLNNYYVSFDNGYPIGQVVWLAEFKEYAFMPPTTAEIPEGANVILYPATVLEELTLFIKERNEHETSQSVN